MEPVTKHPNYDQAVSNLKQRFEHSINADQQAAIALLNLVRAALVSLGTHDKLSLGSDMVDEIADLTKAVESVDPRCIDDDAIALLRTVEMRLSRVAISVGDLAKQLLNDGMKPRVQPS